MGFFYCYLFLHHDVAHHSTAFYVKESNKSPLIKKLIPNIDNNFNFIKISIQ
jgi:hypothetical protein